MKDSVFTKHSLNTDIIFQLCVNVLHSCFEINLVHLNLYLTIIKQYINMEVFSFYFSIILFKKRIRLLTIWSTIHSKGIACFPTYTKIKYLQVYQISTLLGNRFKAKLAMSLQSHFSKIFWLKWLK